MIRLTAVAFAIGLVLVVGLERIATVHAQSLALAKTPSEFLYPGMLPDNPFYIFKSVRYSIEGFFVVGDEAKANWYIKLSDKRLAEFRALLEKGKVDLAMQQLNQALVFSRLAQSHITALVTARKDFLSVTQRLNEHTLRQEFLLKKGVLVPPQVAVTLQAVLLETKSSLDKTAAMLPAVAPAATQSGFPTR